MLFENEEQLKAEIEKDIKAALQETVEWVYEIIKGVTMMWYASYEPEQYERTYQFLCSLVKTRVIKKGGEYSGEIYFDGSKIHYVTGLHPSGNQVITSAMQGFHGATGLHEEPPTIPIWRTSIDFLDAKLYDELKKALLSHGIPIM